LLAPIRPESHSEVAEKRAYQHYQFAGRADLVAWDRGRRALLHDGPPPRSGVTRALALFDPGPEVRDAFRIGELTHSTRPRYPGYADVAQALRDTRARNKNARENPITRCSLSHTSTGPDH